MRMVGRDAPFALQQSVLTNPGSTGPSGLDEFLASYQSKSPTGYQHADTNAGGSFHQDTSQTASSSLATRTQNLPSDL